MFNPSEPYRLSKVWDVYIPFSFAAVPACIFKLLGIVALLFDKPGAKPPLLIIVTLVGLQIVGMIAMAAVILFRFEFCERQLSLRTDGRPPVWRKLVLVFSMVFILIFDILTNFAAVPGCGPLFIFAIPAFLVYLLCIRTAFIKL